MLIFLLICSAAVSAARPTRADSFAKEVVGITKPALVIGAAATLLTSGAKTGEVVAHTGQSMLLSYELTLAMQKDIDLGLGGHHHSFPSKRTATSFALASSLADIHPKQAWIYYAGAAVVGWSTVAVNGHSWGDVIGGAALGIAVGKWSINTEHGPMLGRTYKF